MTEIRDKKDLEIAYLMLKIIRDRNEVRMTAGMATKERQLKKLVRRYHNEQRHKQVRNIVESDYDGYTEVVQLPEWIDTKDLAEDYFNTEEKLIAYPSQYDCTGQRFTLWHSIVRRRGGYWLVHKVGIDV